MAHIMERAIDTERGDAIAATALAMGEVPALREFVVKFKRGHDVRLALSVMGTDSMSVAADHECLREAGEKIDVQPRAVCAFGEVESATQYAQRRARENDRAAIELQVQHLRCVGAL